MSNGISPCMRRAIRALWSGPRLRVSIDGNPCAARLISVGFARIIPHPSITGADGSPAEAYELTDAGRRAMENKAC